MGQAPNVALYRKYRSKSLDEVVGQEHITSTLSHALKTGKMAHAYLFTGPRGTGKTSIARILAHEINSLPYEDDSTHLDIIEIDAASNRRIDEIRELRDKVNLAPSSAQYKVYIIDEVHMLTREAFNALLKTLEEPPEHVVFILATTESHKLPDTIISRTQRFMFKPVDQDKVIAHLKTIADGEGIKIDDEALALVAGYGEGSFRDSISLLDQTRGSADAVTADFVRSLIGQPPDEAITSIGQALNNHDGAGLVTQLTQLRQQGFAAPQVAKQLGMYLRRLVLTGNFSDDTFPLLQKLLEVPAAHNPETFLEIILLGHALAGQGTPVLIAPPVTPKQKPEQKSEPIAKPEPRPEATTVHKTEPNPELEQPTASSPLNEASWPNILDRLKKSHNTLYGIARIARPEFYADRLELHCKFVFHQRRLNEAKNRAIILKAIQEETGQNVTITCLVDEASPTTSDSNTAAAPKSDNALSDISAVFGNAEVIDT